MSEYTEEAPGTVCRKCEHHHRGGSHNIWHGQYCHAVHPGYHFSTLTGRKEQRDWPHCRDVNDGDCGHFAPTGWIRSTLGRVTESVGEMGQ